MKNPDYKEYHGVDEENKCKNKKQNWIKYRPIMRDYINLQCEPYDTRNDCFSYLIAKFYMMLGITEEHDSFWQILALESMDEKQHDIWVCEALIHP